MEFLYPGFLYALAALAIPVIIHLFNFRRFKKIPFTNVRFLRDIQLQTQSQNKLRHLLILLARMLALAFLVLAFAQPLIPNPDETGAAGKRTVSIFVDNSFSMEGESSAGTMIEAAKNRAIDIALAYDAADRFQLLTQDFEGKHQRLVSRDVFIDWVQEVDLSPQSRSLAEIYARQRDLLLSGEEGAQRKIFLLSDFQKSRFDLLELPADTLLGISLVHFERNDLANLYIDSVWFDTPVRKLNDNERLNVRVVNAGKNRVESIPVRLDVNQVQRSLASLSIDGSDRAVATLEYVHESGGLQQAKVFIQDSPVSYDDTWYFSYDVYERIDILNVRESEDSRDAMRNVFAGDSIYQYDAVTARNVDYAALSQYRLVVLQELNEISTGLAASLTDYILNGGSVWVIPGSSADLSEYNAFLSALQLPPFAQARQEGQKVTRLNTEHPLYSGVFESIPSNPDLPQVMRHYPTTSSARSGGDVLMALANGNPYLLGYRPGRGQLYILTSSLKTEDSNFSRHAMFVATALRIAELSQSTRVRAIAISSDAYFTIPSTTLLSEGQLHLVNRVEGTDIIPLYQMREGQYYITPGPEITKAGLYTLEHNGEVVSAVGINYGRDESNLDSYTRSDLGSAIGELSAGRFSLFDGTSDTLGREVAAASSGTALWKICLLLALAFLLAETLLIRFWKSRTT